MGFEDPSKVLGQRAEPQKYVSQSLTARYTLPSGSVNTGREIQRQCISLLP